MLDEKDLQAIAQIMDEKIMASEPRMSDRMDQKLMAQKQDLIQCMNVIIESDVTPKFNLLAEEIASMKKTMATNERVNELEDRMNDRFDVLETAVGAHSREIALLKRAK